MSEITRICAQCGKNNPLEARHCAHCGYDCETGLTPARNSTLPLAISKAALPVLAGAASLLVRAGWRLLKQQLNQAAVQRATSLTPAQAAHPPAPRRDEPLNRRPRTTIHIRSSWAVGDANGLWRQGTSEHKIEIDE